MSAKSEQPDRPAAGEPGDGNQYAGERLGLPATGRGSLTGWPRRIAALLVDWAAANMAAYTVLQDSAMWQAPVTGLDFAPLLTFALEVWILTALLGSSFGHRLLSLRVARLDGRPVGFGRGLVRTLLLLLVVPVILIDADGRGLHDRAAGTVLVHAR